MDNFLDRIAQKLNSNDVIKANTAAEESEMKRLKIKINEYEKLLSEMRQINIHNAELSNRMKATFDQLANLVGGLRTSSLQGAASVGVSDVLTEDLRTEIIDVIIKNGAQALEQSTKRLIEMSGEMSMWLQQSQQRSEETVRRVQQSGEFTENVMSEVSEVLNKNKEAADTIQAASGRINSLLSDISNASSDSLSYTQKIGEQLVSYDRELERYEVANAHIAEVAGQLGQLIQNANTDSDNIFVALEKIVEAMRAIGDKEMDSSALIADISDKILPLISVSMPPLATNLAEISEKIQEASTEQAAAVNELSSKMEDFVHKENVKVYRNVQAVVEDSIKQHGELVDGSLNTIKQDVKSQKLYLIIAIVFSVGSCVVSVLNALGVLVF